MDTAIALLALLSLFSASAGLVWFAAALWQKIRDQRLDAMIDDLEQPNQPPTESETKAERSAAQKALDDAEDDAFYENTLKEIQESYGANYFKPIVDVEALQAEYAKLDQKTLDKHYFAVLLATLDRASQDDRLSQIEEVTKKAVATPATTKKKPAKKKPAKKKSVEKSTKKPAKRR